MIDEYLDGVEQSLLSAGGEDGLVDRVVRAKIAGVALHDCLAHLGNAGDHGVTGKVGLNGVDRRVLDVAGRGEMRLAGPEIHQVRALGA